MAVEVIENKKVNGELVRSVRTYPNKSMMFEAMADFMARGLKHFSTSKRHHGRNKYRMVIERGSNGSK